MIEHLSDKGLGVGFACRVLGLSESAYYARKKRPQSARRLRDEQLMPLIERSMPSPATPTVSAGSPARCDATVFSWHAAPSSG
ncbi:hypothetical protein AB0911_37380 [Streptomyces nigra]|uniref:hypothetical protein n=1 Tax=Streptomyces nigra TaxID=1827580 RepID=UPI003452874A